MTTTDSTTTPARAPGTVPALVGDFDEVLESLTDTLKHCFGMEYDAVVIMLRHDIGRLRVIRDRIANASVSIPGGEPGYAPRECLLPFHKWIQDQTQWVKSAAQSDVVYQAMKLSYEANN